VQLVAKALVSGLVSVVIAIAVTTPGGAAGIAAESAVYNRNVCVALASAAYQAASTGEVVTVPVFSPSQMNVTLTGYSAKCSSGGVSFDASLPCVSLPYFSDLMGAQNVTVRYDGGSLEWW
jgi:hypothetical protein